jgi:hypothetical protein
MLSLSLAALLLLSTPVNTTENIDDLPRKHPLEGVIGYDRAVIAKEIETHLAAHGFDERLARAATINAYAESGLNPSAVGDKGRSVGVFQLNSRGLGHDMTKTERMSVKLSAEKIAQAVYKDGVLIDMQSRCDSLEDMVKAFTIRIERPSNAKKKAVARSKLADEFSRGLPDTCVPKV